MADYSNLSDFEINKRVALIIAPELSSHECFDVNGHAVFHDKSGTCGFSFTRTPADAWPIIIENKIGVRNISGDLWECASPDGMKADYSSRPLRSAMIVFLMIQE